MLKVENLNFSYKKHLVLEGIDFTVGAGEMVAILGLNGSGKSTLLKAVGRIAGLRTGTVTIADQDLEALSRPELARLIGYLPQKSQGEPVTVYDAVLLGRKSHLGLIPAPRDLEIVDETLRYFELEELAFRSTGELSGGELQKVLIARAIVQEPKLLLLDEPINHLDLYNQLEVMNIIRRLVAERRIIALIVSHDLNTALRYCDKFILLRDKRLYACGRRDIITPRTIQRVFRVKTTITQIDGIPLVIPR